MLIVYKFNFKLPIIGFLRIFEEFAFHMVFLAQKRRITREFELHGRFTYYTNNFYLAAKDIALLYKYRWQVDLFFYDKFIVMRSHSKCISDNQNVTFLLLVSALHNNMAAMTSFHLNVRTN